MYRWLTPNDEGGTMMCLSLHIRKELVPAIYGAVEQLADSSVWQEIGTMTPEQAAALCFAAFESMHDKGDYCMIGMIVQYITDTPPPNVIAGNATYDKDDYPLLYDKLPTAWTTPTTFTLPDLSGVYMRNAGGSSVLGDMLGQDSVTLTTANLPPIAVSTHNHPVPSVDVESPAGVPDVSAGVPSPLVIDVGGSSQSIDNRPLSIVVNVGVIAK